MADVEHRSEVSTEDSPEHRASSPLFLDFDPLSFTFTDNGGVDSGAMLDGDDLPHAAPTELTLSPSVQELTSSPSKDNTPSPPPASLPSNLTFSQPDIVTSSQQELTPSPLDVLNGYPQKQIDALDENGYEASSNNNNLDQIELMEEGDETYQSILHPTISLLDELDLVSKNTLQAEADNLLDLEETAHSPISLDELDLVPNNTLLVEADNLLDLEETAHSPLSLDELDLVPSSSSTLLADDLCGTDDHLLRLEETHSPMSDTDSPLVLEELVDLLEKKEAPSSLLVESFALRREDLVLSPLEPNYIQISEDDDILSPQDEIEVSPKEDLTLSPLETVTPLPSDEFVLTPLKKSPEEPGKSTPPGDLNLAQVGELNFFDPLSTIYESPVHERFNPNKTINNDTSPTDMPKAVETFFDPFAPICESSDDSPSQVTYPDPADNTADSGTAQSIPDGTPPTVTPMMEDEIIIRVECVDDNPESLPLDPFFNPINSNDSSTPELEEALELTDEDVEKKKSSSSSSSSSKKKTVETKSEAKVTSSSNKTVTNSSSTSVTSKKEDKRHVSTTSIQLEKTPAKIHNVVTNGKDKEKSAFLEQTPEPVNGHSKVEAPILDEIKPSVDPAKVVRKFSQNEKDPVSQCKACGKHVYQMEKLKAEKFVFHKQCFRCKECNKLLHVENYSAHEGTIYCKQHFRSLFQPKVKLDAEDCAPKRQRRHEMIIRENTPMELPPDVVRCESKPDYGLESLPSLGNVRSRFESTNGNHPLSPSKSELPIQRSESIMMRLARYQSAVRGELKNEEASSESDEDEEGETHIFRGDKAPKDEVAFTGLSNLKSQWEKGEVKSQKEDIIEMKREELKRLRQRMCLGRSESMKLVYEKACHDSKVVTPTREHMLPPHLPHADKIKEKFEKGEVTDESTQEKKEKLKSEKEDDLSVFSETGLGHNARNLFKQMDANTRITSPLMSPCKSPSRDIKKSYTQPFAQPDKANEDVVKCSEPTAKDEITVETVEVSQKFKFFENYHNEPKERKRFQMTPPREPAPKEESPEPEIPRNPDIVRCTNGHDEVPVTDTARKMLDKFKAMEDSVDRPNVPTGLKPLKRITPPREFIGTTEHDSSPEPERDPSIIKSSYKMEDDIQVEADMAKTLREKFEKWQVDIVNNSNHHNEEDDLLPQIDTAKNLRAKFEAIKEESYRIKEKPLPRVKRFIQEPMQCPSEDCSTCGKKVYPMEKLETSGLKFHKSCFRCCQCNCMLRLENYTTSGGQVFCSQDFKQLFISKGVCGDQLVSPSNGHL